MLAHRPAVLWSALAIWLGAIPAFAGIEKPIDSSRNEAAPTARWDGVVDLAGRPQNPFADESARAVVLIFISIECPICNRYAPEIQRLQVRYSEQGVVFWLVQPDTDDSPAETRKYLKEFGYSFGLLRDPKHTLVNAAGARITPEAAVFGADGKFVYRGRIDNRYADYGKTRIAPTQRELNSVLEDILAGRAVTVSNAPAVGCFISR